MAWEQRSSRARYYYRSRRTVDGSVRRVYIGRGPLAEQAAYTDAAARRLREADTSDLADEQRTLTQPDAMVRELADVAQLMFEAALLAAGYHRPNYGPWRKRRG